ncbi:hypothetical protein CspeluHIS016_0700790 [Cutaneotrichosporon spelunceum]|uniref:Ubiquinol-cytochrome c chaperone domain-containing protein n=1 Tax=Cutaneotrichosporon spelunceum TaxID=1672016 RepID=A0AAD3YEI8_9TREE|nr:hypothetical protein CspeluHIS016_0700790 [Cutaneotrichosporon spelunceum]
MSALRTARALARVPRLAPPSRTFAVSSALAKEAKAVNNDPIPLKGSPQFPPPVDPFDPEAAKSLPPTEYSESTKTIVRGVAKLLGYNSKASTAIRETGRMMRGIVTAVEKERSFWYDECKLPATYQTFFQLHLLYVLILVVRLRALRSSRPDPSPIPEPLEPGKPSNPASAKSGFTIGKPAHETYPTEFLNHFFELAESQMRIVLGKGERERVIRKYMDEMGEQWKGAGLGLDFILGLSISEEEAERALSDPELASWVWRNLFQSKGVNPGEGDELAFPPQLEKVVFFVRRELARLDEISDIDVLEGNIGEWTPVNK